MNRDLMVLIVLLLGASLEALAATRDLVPGSRVTLSLRSARQEEEEPDYAEDADSDLSLDSLGGLEDALRTLTSLARDLDELENRIVKEMEEMRSAATTTTTTTTTPPPTPAPKPTFDLSKFGGGSRGRQANPLDFLTGLSSLSNLATELDELEDHLDQMRNRNRILPRMRDRNTLGNVGTLLQDAVDSTEDLARRSGGSSTAEQLANLSPAMRMAIVKNRIMMKAKKAEEEEEREARLDSGLVEATTDEQSREGQNTAQLTADFLSEVLDVVTTIDNTVLSFGENAIEKKFNLLTTLIQLLTGTSSGK